MKYRVEFIHNRSVFFAFPFGVTDRDPGAIQRIAREIVRGYFGEEGDQPSPTEPSPLIPETVHIVDRDERIVASWSLREEFVERRRQRATA